MTDKEKQDQEWAAKEIAEREAKITTSLRGHVVGDIDIRSTVLGSVEIHVRLFDDQKRLNRAVITFAGGHDNGRAACDAFLSQSVISAHQANWEAGEERKGPALDVHGYWKKRNWKDNQNKWHNQFEFQAMKVDVADADGKFLSDSVKETFSVLTSEPVSSGAGLGDGVKRGQLVMLNLTNGQFDEKESSEILTNLVRVATPTVRVMVKTENDATVWVKNLQDALGKGASVRATTPKSLAALLPSQRASAVAYIQDGRAFIVSKHTDPKAAMLNFIDLAKERAAERG